MALVKCEDCGREVSTEAAACPNCGRPVSASATPAAAAQSPPPISPPPPQPSAHAQPPTPNQPAPKKKNWFRRHKILTAILALIVLGIIGAAASGSSKKNATNGNSSGSSGGPATTAAKTHTTTQASKPKAKPKPSLTGPQQQAVQAAQNYLSVGEGFSRAGLIQQLSSSAGSGFPKAVAVFAVNHLNVNWDQQAVQAAKNYKATGGGFSCSGMVQQLASSAGSGFTHAQAAYAARKVGVC